MQGIRMRYYMNDGMHGWGWTATTTSTNRWSHIPWSDLTEDPVGEVDAWWEPWEILQWD